MSAIEQVDRLYLTFSISEPLQRQIRAVLETQPDEIQTGLVDSYVKDNKAPHSAQEVDQRIKRMKAARRAENGECSTCHDSGGWIWMGWRPHPHGDQWGDTSSVRPCPVCRPEGWSPGWRAVDLRPVPADASKPFPLSDEGRSVVEQARSLMGRISTRSPR